MKTKLFVYGTLRPGNAETVQIPGKMFALGWFPGVKLSDNSENTFTAEVLEIDEANLTNVDRYEGYDPDNEEMSLFVRRPYQDGFIYEFNGKVDNKPQVMSGDWLQYTGKGAGVNASLPTRG